MNYRFHLPPCGFNRLLVFAASLTAFAQADPASQNIVSRPRTLTAFNSIT